MTFATPRRRIFEYLAYAAVIMIVLFLVGSNLYYQNKLSRQKTLFYQLEILRSSINLYKVINKGNPPSLIVLAKGVYQFPGDTETKRYIENAPIDKMGQVVDPFGGAYTYDSETGWVRSATKGYEFW